MSIEKLSAASRTSIAPVGFIVHDELPVRLAQKPSTTVNAFRPTKLAGISRPITSTY